MKNDEQIFYKIEDFLTGKLPKDVAAAFEREIATDPELAETVEMQRFEREGLEFMMEEKLRAEMESWKTSPPPLPDLEKMHPPSGKVPDSPRLGRKFLLLLLLPLVVGFFYFLSPPTIVKAPTTPPNPKDSIPQSPNIPAPKAVESKPEIPESKVPIANTADKKLEKAPRPAENKYAVLALSNHKTPLNLSDGLRSEPGEAAKNVLAPALHFLKKDPPDYQSVILELQKINQQEYPTAFETAQEMLGHAYLKTGQFDKAATIFEGMTKQNLSRTAHDQAEWYLVLSLLPDYPKQKKRVDEMLKRMIDPSAYHGHQKDAEDLKKALGAIGN